MLGKNVERLQNQSGKARKSCRNMCGGSSGERKM